MIWRSRSRSRSIGNRGRNRNRSRRRDRIICSTHISLGDARSSAVTADIITAGFTMPATIGARTRSPAKTAFENPISVADLIV